MLRIYYRTVMDTCTVLLQLSRVELRCKLQEDRAFTGLLQLVNKLQQTCQCHACCNLSILSLLQLWRGGGRNLDETSGHGCYCQEGWGPAMRNYLLVLRPDPGSRQPWFIQSVTSCQQTCCNLRILGCALRDCRAPHSTPTFSANGVNFLVNPGRSTISLCTCVDTLPPRTMTYHTGCSIFNPKK